MSVRIPFLTERAYDFSTLAASATSDVIIVKALDIVPYRSGELQVRVHAASWGGGSPALVLKAYVTAPSRDDPSVDFVGDAKATATLSSAAAGDLVNQALAPKFGSHLRLVLEATQGSPAGTLQATISGELVLSEEP